ncbi:MAG: hypothetical protein WCK98_06770 [bacterium]
MTDNSEKNPFNQEEPMQSWFEQDKFYQHSNKHDLGKLKVKLNYKLSIFMSLQDSYLKTIQAITKHAILATLVMLIALGGVGASAAQILAPDEYKPSKIAENLFKANKQKDKDPYTSLAPDNDNYVANLDKCNLGLKYPRIFNSSATTFFVYDKDNEYSYTINSDENLKNLFSVACDTKKIVLNTDYYNYNERGDFVKRDIQTSNINTQELSSTTGWLITQAEITDINKVEVNGELKQLYFTYKSIYYQVLINDINFAKNTQLQFNSLVTNTFSDQIKASKKEEGSIVKDCNDILDVKYNPTIYKTQNVFNDETGIFLTNFVQEKELKNYNEATAVRVQIQCVLNTADLKGKLLPLTPFKSTKDKIPFISDYFKSQIVDSEVYQRIYELDGKGDPEGVKTDYVEIFFRDKQNIYKIYVDKLAAAQKSFGLTIDRKKILTNDTSSSSSVATTISGILNDEEFEVLDVRPLDQGQGSAIYGYELKRVSDNKIFVVTGDTMKNSLIPKNIKIKISGRYYSKSESLFSKGNETAELAIWEVTKVSQTAINTQSQKITKVLTKCNLQIVYPGITNNFSGKSTSVNEGPSMGLLTFYPNTTTLIDNLNIVADTVSDPLNRQDGMRLQTDCYEGALDVDKYLAWLNLSPLNSPATLTKPTKADFCKDYNISASDCTKINNISKISYDQNYSTCFDNTFTAMNKTFVISNCNFSAKGVEFSFK